MAFAALVALALSGLAAAGAQADQRLYVALGDSYTSGPSIPVQLTNPAGCHRSDHNYQGVSLVAFHSRALADRDTRLGTSMEASTAQPTTPSTSNTGGGGCKKAIGTAAGLAVLVSALVMVASNSGFSGKRAFIVFVLVFVIIVLSIVSGANDIPGHCQINLDPSQLLSG